ncbi:MAG: MBL fold metallo-hydrolase [Candidatus Krumholzibacteria bacterium]|nr:MBL fold metallo-hydrolase [Candidatus Krumholzibacteria bacterium]
MKEISQEDLRERLVAGESITLLDIREMDEFSDWHIHGSLNLPMYNAINAGQHGIVKEKMREVTLDADKPVVAVCRMGNTSKVAADALQSMGYDAFSLIGGIFRWSNAWTEARISLSTAKDSTLFQIRRNGKGCLSYVFGSNGEAAVVDPCVDVSVYTSIAEREGFKIVHVLETHVHADHVSRARALCEATGARLSMRDNDRVQFEYNALHDRDEIKVGTITITAAATPGHTMESVCFSVDGEVLLTGDTLFVENIGRPDLEKGDAGAGAGARALYDSLHNRVLKFDDDITICPGHTSSSIGFDGAPIAGGLRDISQRIELLRTDKEDFAKLIPELLGAKPPNFERVIAINEGKAELGWLDPLELEAGPNRCAVK